MGANQLTSEQIATRYQVALDILVEMILAQEKPEDGSGGNPGAIGQEGGEGNQQERVAKLCEGSQG